MSVRTEQDNLHVNALVVDENTLRYGGSLFLRSQDEPCSVVEAWDGKGGRPMLCMCDARDKRSIQLLPDVQAKEGGQVSINRVTITGNLTRDPDLRSTQSGMSVLSLGVAVNDRRKNQKTGEWEDYPNFIDCTIWGTRAEKIAGYLSKGSKVAIEGKLRWSQWERDGQKRSKIEVIIDEIEFLSRGDHPEVQVSQPAPTQPANVQTQMPGMPVARPVVDASIYDTDIPF